MITLSGNIGVGKTTLGKHIAQELNALWLPEDAFSSLFGNLVACNNHDTRIVMQMAFSTMRVATLLSGVLSQQHEIIVVERSLRDSLVFHRVWRKLYDLSQYDAFFSQFYNLLTTSIQYDEYIVWLKCSLDVLLNRISSRGTTADVAHTRELLRGLEDEYEALYKDFLPSPLIIDTENLQLDDYSVFGLVDQVKAFCAYSDSEC